MTFCRKSAILMPSPRAFSRRYLACTVGLTWLCFACRPCRPPPWFLDPMAVPPTHLLLWEGKGDARVWGLWIFWLQRLNLPGRVCTVQYNTFLCNYMFSVLIEFCAGACGPRPR